MYNLPLPTCSPLDDYDYVMASRSAKNAAVLATLRPHVDTAYTAYQSNLAKVRPITLQPSEAKVLRGNFDRIATGKPCDSIRSELLASTRDGQCPYCRLEDAWVLDHILEKKPYPEYSVLRYNLAPVCSRCNTAKENNASRFTGRPKFHLYFMGYPAKDFLELKIDVSGRLASFEFALAKPSGMPAVDFDALEAHFGMVDLRKRYARRARVEMRDRKLEMQRLHKKFGVKSVQKFLQRQAASVAHNWSPTDWAVVLFETASADAGFCDSGIYLL